ncbi:MAG: DUF1080 domain-containing protein [Planctomycetaceae bacterium]|nr:DUF1080 domain-containing protein [Planctomycetaceae bacterium]
MLRSLRLPFEILPVLFLIVSATTPSSLEAANPSPSYDGFVSLRFDGQAVNGLRFEDGIAPQHTEGTLLVTDVQPQPEARIDLDCSLADFDLWIECRSTGTAAGAAYTFSLKDDSQKPYRELQTWGIPAISEIGDQPTLIHLSRRGMNLSFRSAPVGGVWTRPISAFCQSQSCNRLGFKFEPAPGEQIRISKITLGEPRFRSLFNGQDLTGWVGYPGEAEEAWSVEQGELKCNGMNKVWLRSAEEHADFNLSFDYKLNAGGNSGLFVRVPADGNHHRENESLPPAGLEIQLLDDAADQYKALKDYQYSASVYDIVGASPRVSRPAGEWNSFQIDANADRLQVWHNGIKVVDADESQFPLLALRLRKGFLGLQNHSSVISFRNLRLGPPLAN